MARFTRNAITVLAARYLRKDGKGKVVETPEAMFRRVAANIALADVKHKYSIQEPFLSALARPSFKRHAQKDRQVRETGQRFYRMMADLDFLPNSPTLFNAGRELQQLAGCFVLPIDDSLDSIFAALREAALIHQSGGGTGFSFSRLRPRGDTVRSTDGVASGPVSFMHIFDAATEQIRQGGKRRGANMGILRVDHPDIEEFVRVKDDPALLQNFNISVAASDQFMRCVKQNRSYPLVNPRTGKRIGTRNARAIFQLIAKQVWKTADPGIIFIDRINRLQPTPQLGRIESTNPCGEVPLLPYEACNLGSINLARFVKEGAIDYDRLRVVVWDAVHFLDNVIDMSNYPLPEITRTVHGNRKIGLGVMGFADMLFQLGISYASPEGLAIGEKVMRFIDEEAKKASVALAKQRGVFPNFKSSAYDTGRKEDRVRNATRTSIAPTGTLSIIAGCSSGIEPAFGLAFTHTVLEQQGLFEVNSYLVDVAKKRGFYSQGFMRHLTAKGTLDGMNVPSDVKNVFVTSHDVPADYHVRMQAVFQRHTDNAVSKTVNLPARAISADVARVYMLAYDLGCKGISVYRDTSKQGQVLTTGHLPKKAECPLC